MPAADESKKPVVEKNSLDVEMDAPTEASDSAQAADVVPAIPTFMDIFYDFNGSLGFAIGSSGFILEKYHDNWLPYFRYGALVWIWGCVAYTVPLVLKLRGEAPTPGGGRQRACPWGLGDWGLFVCCLFYTVGCVLGGFFEQPAVEDFLPAINHAFLYGSLALALEPLQQAALFLARGGSLRRRVGLTKLCGAPPAAGDEDDAPLKPLKLSWDRTFELFAMIFFIAAAVFGGFPPHPSHVLPGVYFWEVGSLFSVARSFVMVHNRKCGLKAQAMQN